MKLKKLSSIIIACGLFMTGCTGATTENGGSNASESSSASYPMTISHAYGETVIESQPERVATISWGNQDVPLALGIVPVGVSKANYGETDKNGLLPWTGEKYAELGEESPVVYDDVDGLDYEAISDSNPDIILAAYSGITQEEYDLLILDEIIATINNEFIELNDVIEFLRNKPKSLEVVMTGRDPKDELVELSNYVTEMKCIKHPFKEGIPSRVGIEL